MSPLRAFLFETKDQIFRMTVLTKGYDVLYDKDCFICHLTSSERHLLAKNDKS